MNKLFLKLTIKYPFLNRFLPHNYGLIPEKLKEKDFVFGGLGLQKKVLSPNGQWLDVLPSEEKQQGRRVETMACTCFSLLNVLEMLAKKKAYGEWNKPK